MSTESQAPCVNFVPRIMTATTAVATAPRALIKRPVFQPNSFTRSQCLTMPDCDSVNETKTPNAYRGISRVTSPPNAASKTAAAPASSMMPFE